MQRRKPDGIHQRCIGSLVQEDPDNSRVAVVRGKHEWSEGSACYIASIDIIPIESTAKVRSTELSSAA